MTDDEPAPRSVQDTARIDEHGRVVVNKNVRDVLDLEGGEILQLSVAVIKRPKGDD